MDSSTQLKLMSLNHLMEKAKSTSR